jgi:hypothetical protein
MPDGAMVAASDRSWVIVGGRFYRWSLAGYEPSPTPAHLDGLLTPPSTLSPLCTPATGRSFTPPEPVNRRQASRNGRKIWTLDDLFGHDEPTLSAREVMAQGAMLFRGLALPYEDELLRAPDDITVHHDKNERNFANPIVSISLGLPDSDSRARLGTRKPLIAQAASRRESPRP